VYRANNIFSDDALQLDPTNKDLIAEKKTVVNGLATARRRQEERDRNTASAEGKVRLSALFFDFFSGES
jgi:hypothetical protein